MTYSVDLVLYDGLIRRRLRQAGAVNQMVFCDFRKYQEQLTALGAARRFGRSYSVTPVHQAAAFHPKLYMVLGRKGGRLLIGSGNATIGGLLRNAETFGLFEYERGRDAGPHPAFRQCFEFVEQVCRRGPDVVQKQIARARSWSPWLDVDPVPDHRTVLFGGPGRQPLLAQITADLAEKPVQDVLVCTASVDRQLAGLRSLAALTKRGKVQCIVQPEHLRLDGQAVRLLGKTVDWRPFVDPYPREKTKRRDVFAHAKLMVFNCGDSEIVAYGSANASKPAFLGNDGNTEIVVLFAPWRRGTAVKRLGLEASLKARDITKQLGEQTWGAEPDEDEGIPHTLALTAAVPTPNGVSIQIWRGRVPEGAVLDLYEGLGRPPLLCGKVVSASGGFSVRLRRGVPGNVRIAGLVTEAGEPLSNLVGLTWPEVATVQSSSGIHARTEAAIVAMQDGALLGTVLFELLDQVRDFEVVRGHGRTSKRESVSREDPSEENRSVESFYTDAVPGETAPTAWTGDRTDIDLLAALVQPLQTGAHSAKQAVDEEDEADDSVLAEEAERREIDSKGGRATGQEGRESSSITSKQALERASKRLRRRLDRAAIAVEKALAQRRDLVSVPPVALARQIWMAHIAAFLSGRNAPTSDREPVLCLEPLDFAAYVLRICRALAGGKDGGLLRLVSEGTFAGPDGESLKRGLSFLWTCAIFAVAEVADYWAKPSSDADDEESEYANDIWDAVPELIAARFVLAIRAHCRKPDLHNITRRLPGWGEFADGWFEQWKTRMDRLADLINRVERGKVSRAETHQYIPGLDAGALIFNPDVGVTVLARMGDNRKCYLVDLSLADGENPRNILRVFSADRVRKLSLPPTLEAPTWRAPSWLMPDSD